ncbi:hypothetical protein LEP1GSC052_3905 [Leptospira kmetyi serovar Malaysia str. Bejo-Iso9]|nr:hypothetical protein LEP1GSC052_3905 [Leptospira kmetyi serovar Malaysia str. Bejo-Iso9]
MKEESAGKMQRTKESRESFFGPEFRPKKKKILPKSRKTTLMSLIWKKVEKKFVPSLYLGL